MKTGTQQKSYFLCECERIQIDLTLMEQGQGRVLLRHYIYAL